MSVVVWSATCRLLVISDAPSEANDSSVTVDWLSPNTCNHKYSLTCCHLVNDLLGILWTVNSLSLTCLRSYRLFKDRCVLHNAIRSGKWP